MALVHRADAGRRRFFRLAALATKSHRGGQLYGLERGRYIDVKRGEACKECRCWRQSVQEEQGTKHAVVEEVGEGGTRDEAWKECRAGGTPEHRRIRSRVDRHHELESDLNTT